MKRLLAAARELWRTRKAELAVVGFAVLLRIYMGFTYDVIQGYDYPTHRQYVQWLVDHGALPRFDLNVATYHPPLYYALGATLLRLGAPNQALGAISILAGCLRMILLWVGLELYLPSPRRRFARLVALVLGAIFPTALHLEGMATNEGVSALCCLAATLLIPPALAAGDRRRAIKAGAALGGALGLALLSKVSATAIGLAFAGGVAAGMIWAVRGRRGDAGALVPRVVAPLVAGLVTLVVAGWFFIRNDILYGKAFVTGYDGPAKVVVAVYENQPYLDRRTLGYVLGFTPDVLGNPYYPSGSAPHPRFWSVLLASTFADHFSFGFAPAPKRGQPSTMVHGKPISPVAFATSCASVVGGVAIALVTVLAWLAAMRAVWRGRDAGLLALLLVPLFAVAGQLHFAILYSNDTFGPVKGLYLQFAAPVLYALFGLGVAWLWERPRARPLAVLALVAVAAVASYTLYCRVIAA